MLEKVIPEAFEKSLKKGKIFVSSIEDAKNCIANEKEPLCIQFSTNSLGSEDLPKINKLEESVKNQDIFILYDEADFTFGTKEERGKHYERTIKVNRKTNSGQLNLHKKLPWYRDYEKKLVTK